MQRRDFLKGLLAASVASLLNYSLDATSLQESVSLQKLKDGIESEHYWRLVRKHFLLSDKGIFLNNGSHGVCPRCVVDSVIESIVKEEKVFEGHLRPSKDFRKKMARLIGADEDEIVFLRNTTEGMNLAAASFRLKKGDEILTTNHEHVGGLCMWEMKAEREGLKLRKVELPLSPSSPQELLRAVYSAVTKRTKVISISHIFFTNGVVFPVKQLCEFARKRGIVTVIDGAHGVGMLKLNMHDIGCDFYASSLHKWLLAPKGTGLLYIRREIQDRLYPLIASGGWNNKKLGSLRFERIGTRNYALLYGVEKVLDFYYTIGPERIYRRIKQLNTYLRRKLREVDGVEIVSPEHPDLYAGLVSIKVRGWKAKDLYNVLRKDYSIVVRLVSEYDYNLIRVSTHIYNSEEEIDRFVEVISSLVKPA